MRGGKVIEYEQIICSEKIRVCSGFSTYLPLLFREKYFSMFRNMSLSGPGGYENGYASDTISNVWESQRGN